MDYELLARPEHDSQKNYPHYARFAAEETAAGVVELVFGVQLTDKQEQKREEPQVLDKP